MPSVLLLVFGSEGGLSMKAAVYGPVAGADERAAVILGRGESWLTRHAGELRVWLSLGFGVALVAVALLRLFV